MLIVRVPAGERSARQAIDCEVEGSACGKQRAAAGMLPSADDRRKAGERSHGHAAAAVTLHPVIEPKQRRMGCRVEFGERDDFLNADPRDLRDAVERIVLQGTLAQKLGADGRFGEIIFIRKMFSENDVHHSQGERGVRPRSD